MPKAQLWIGWLPPVEDLNTADDTICGDCGFHRYQCVGPPANRMPDVGEISTCRHWDDEAGEALC